MSSTRTHEHTLRCWWNHDLAGWVCAPAPALDLPLQALPVAVDRLVETEVTADLAGAVADLP